jgi:hypothetical protein
MRCFRYRNLCLCPVGGRVPEGALAVEEPFTPLVFLFERDPLVSRGFFAIRSLTELDESEGLNLLLPPQDTENGDGMARFAAEHGAGVLNTAFSRAFDAAEAYFSRGQKPPRVHVLGLGNVGGTTATALKLLGTDLEQIGVFDSDPDKCRRYEAELNQILPPEDGKRLPPVAIKPDETLFSCEALLFTAAKAVPDIGAESGGDVRMMQYEANRELLRGYARLARESGFTGLFAQISDPVDQLCRAVFLMSNQDERGAFDWNGLLPEQVRGFGLGVMRARALYCAARDGVPGEQIRAYGPHGKGLVIANAPGAEYDTALSRTWTHRTEAENLRVRFYGYKPYIAPGISSAAVSVLRALRGEWHDAAVPLGGVYFGCYSRLGPTGPQMRREMMNPELFDRIKDSYLALKEFDERWAD